jgi:hypothetical protein
VSAAWAKERIGVRISPTGNYNDMRDSDPQATFTHAARALGAARPRLPARHRRPCRAARCTCRSRRWRRLMPQRLPAARLILNGGYDAKTAGGRDRAQGKADLVAFGVALPRESRTSSSAFRHGCGPQRSPTSRPSTRRAPRATRDYPSARLSAVGPRLRWVQAHCARR